METPAGLNRAQDMPFWCSKPQNSHNIPVFRIYSVAKYVSMSTSK